MMEAKAYGKSKDECHTALVRHIRASRSEGLAIGRHEIKKVGSEWVGRVEIISTRRNQWEDGLGQAR